MTKVAIQGIRGSYSEEAAIGLFGESVELIECKDFAQAILTARAGTALAVIPVKNSITGTIFASDSLIRASKLKVHNRIDVRIDHLLAGMSGADVRSITAVHSHPEALKQCSKFFASNPQIMAKPGSDTASSIRGLVAANNQHKAAIGSRRAAEMYGATILCHNIADATDNRTTFYLLGR